MNRARTRDRGWLRALRTVQSPADRLVCFPHSGGAAGTYREWPSWVPGDIEVLAVQYPGHADRIAEATADSVLEMAMGVVEQLAELAAEDPARVSLFGHSFGTVVAYETARVLQDIAMPAHALFVSGAPAPTKPVTGLSYTASDDELWGTLRDLGGIEPEIAENDELRELLLPTMRSDITLHQTYRPDPDAEPLQCPVHCYYNVEDPLVDDETAGAWAQVGVGPYRETVLPGGHFRIVDDPAELISDIVGALAGSDALR